MGRATGGIRSRSGSPISSTTDFGNQVSTVTRADFGRRTTVETTYEDDTHRRFGLASKVETTGCPPGEVNCTTRETTFDYDEAGNRVETVVEPNGAEDAYLKTTTDYGESGEVRKVTVEDKKGEERPETFDYDDDLLYPTTVTNARGHTTTTKTHSGLGLPLEVTDPNGVTTTMKYDTFGRLRETNYADGDFERIGHFGFLGDMIATTTLADGRETKTHDAAWPAEGTPGAHVRRQVVTGVHQVRRDGFGRVGVASRPPRLSRRARRRSSTTGVAVC